MQRAILGVMIFIYLGVGNEKIKKYFGYIFKEPLSFTKVFCTFSFLVALTGLYEFLANSDFSLTRFATAYGIVILVVSVCYFLKTEFLVLGILSLTSFGSLSKGGYGLLMIVSLLLAMIYLRNVDIGYSFKLTKRDVKIAFLSYLAFVAIAIPLAFWFGYIRFEFILPSPVHFLKRTAQIFLSPALKEEIIFRGFLQNFLMQRFKFKNGKSTALVLASAIFGIGHLGHGSVIYAFLSFIAGLFYGNIYIKTGNVVPAALMHTLVDLRALYGIIKN